MNNRRREEFDILKRRILFYVLMQIIKDGNEERLIDIESRLSSGLATYLYLKYRECFEKFDFCESNLNELDNYFRKFIGCFDSEEPRKFCCQENDGLWFSIALLLED